MGLFGRKDTSAPRKSLWQKITDVALTDVTVLARGGVDAGSLEALERLLLESDFGVRVTARLVQNIERRASRGEIKSQDDFSRALREEIEHALTAGNSSTTLVYAETKPTVILVLGVNGAGKTTFIGKLASRLSGEGKKVLVAAGDTFRVEFRQGSTVTATTGSLAVPATGGWQNWTTLSKGGIALAAGSSRQVCRTERCTISNRDRAEGCDGLDCRGRDLGGGRLRRACDREQSQCDTGNRGGDSVGRHHVGGGSKVCY